MLAGFRFTQTTWEAHHKVPVVDGGGQCGLEGMETLCHWCHAEETLKILLRPKRAAHAGGE